MARERFRESKDPFWRPLRRRSSRRFATPASAEACVIVSASGGSFQIGALFRIENLCLACLWTLFRFEKVLRFTLGALFRSEKVSTARLDAPVRSENSG